MEHRLGGGDDAFFPHAREWTSRAILRVQDGRVFPARAGVDPGHAMCAIFPASFSRTRGSGPSTMRNTNTASWFFPHAREWTFRHGRVPPPCRVFPARAGVDPALAICAAPSARFSRTRGSGPPGLPGIPVSSPFFPHAREWTSGVRPVFRTAQVFPARAGVDRKW